MNDIVPEAPEQKTSGAESGHRSENAPRFAVGVVLVALSAALFAIAFRWLLSTVVFAVAGTHDVVSAMRAAPMWSRMAIPTLGGFLAGLVGMLVARSPANQGVSDVMEAIVLGRVRLSMRSTLLKSTASWLAIVCGGSIGREGPLIQFGGASGQLIGERLELPSGQVRVLIAAGTAAGFAAAYNTPFAAILFVLEVVLGVVVLDAIVPALVATVIATTATRAIVGEGPVYGQRAFSLISPFELIAFAGLGIFVALGTLGFRRLLSVGEKAFRTPRLSLPWRPAVGGLLAGLVLVWLPEAAGNGYEPLNALLDGQFTVEFVALLLVGKCLATTASVSSGAPGGVFTPTLLVGGALGFLFASGVHALGIHTGPPGGYALVGMAAATAASTHAPLMAAVMVFELSGDYAVALPLVLATAVATVVSRKIKRESMYATELRARGIGWEITMKGRDMVDVAPPSR